LEKVQISKLFAKGYDYSITFYTLFNVAYNVININEAQFIIIFFNHKNSKKNKIFNISIN